MKRSSGAPPQLITSTTKLFRELARTSTSAIMCAITFNWRHFKRFICQNDFKLTRSVVVFTNRPRVVKYHKHNVIKNSIVTACRLNGHLSRTSNKIH